MRRERKKREIGCKLYSNNAVKGLWIYNENTGKYQFFEQNHTRITEEINQIVTKQTESIDYNKALIKELLK